MANALEGMAAWMGVLLRGGMIFNEREEQAVKTAMTVLGEERLEELRRFFAEQKPEQADQERVGAIQLCLWMANADRELASEERELLDEVIDRSDLPSSEKERLRDSMGEDPDVDGAIAAVNQPGLRRLVLALAWELAESDGTVDQDEQRVFDRLTEAFGLDKGEVADLKAAVARVLGSRVA